MPKYPNSVFTLIKSEYLVRALPIEFWREVLTNEQIGDLLDMKDEYPHINNFINRITFGTGGGQAEIEDAVPKREESTGLVIHTRAGRSILCAKEEETGAIVKEEAPTARETKQNTIC